MPYATNFLPGISNTVALPEDGQVGQIVGQYIKSLKNKQFCCDGWIIVYFFIYYHNGMFRIKFNY